MRAADVARLDGLATFRADAVIGELTLDKRALRFLGMKVLHVEGRAKHQIGDETDDGDDADDGPEDAVRPSLPGVDVDVDDLEEVQHGKECDDETERRHELWCKEFLDDG